MVEIPLEIEQQIVFFNDMLKRAEQEMIFQAVAVAAFKERLQKSNSTSEKLALQSLLDKQIGMVVQHCRAMDRAQTALDELAREAEKGDPRWFMGVRPKPPLRITPKKTEENNE